MKDKTQKDYVITVRIIFLIFCCTFGSNCSVFPLGFEQLLNIYNVADVPNPRNESVFNWVSNPNQILDQSCVEKVNKMLAQLEDSLSIEVAVVALPSIGENTPTEFAHKLFEHWGVGKKADDNGLLILLVLDQRTVTFETGYGLEGVLPDALCFRIQQKAMVPWFKEGNFDEGMVQGVQAVTLTLYGSDYESASQDTWGIHWERIGETFRDFLTDIPFILYLIFWIVLILLNVIVGFVMANGARPKNNSAAAAIHVLTHYKPFGCGCLILFFPIWPALFIVSLWYKYCQYRRVILQSETCDSCKAVALQLLSDELAEPLLSTSERMENQLKSAIHRIYRCSSCEWTLRYNSTVTSEYRMCNQCHTIARKQVGSWKTIKEPTYSDNGLEVADYVCQMCGDKKQAKQTIPRKVRSSSSSSGGHSHSSGGSRSGSFGGGRSGGGGATSSF
nr:TPM domain-containing protein [Bacteroides sp.]